MIKVSNHKLCSNLSISICALLEFRDSPLWRIEFSFNQNLLVLCLSLERHVVSVNLHKSKEPNTFCYYREVVSVNQVQLIDNRKSINSSSNSPDFLLCAQ